MTKGLLLNPLLEKYPNPFSTYDLGVCAGLVSLGYKLLQIDKTHGDKALFLFENTEEVMETAQLYWKGELMVNALDYFNSVRTIKNQLYSK